MLITFLPCREPESTSPRVCEASVDATLAKMKAGALFAHGRSGT
jgi:hypothetical protein